MVIFKPFISHKPCVFKQRSYNSCHVADIQSQPPHKRASEELRDTKS